MRISLSRHRLGLGPYSDPLIALGHQPVLRCQDMDMILVAVVCLLPGHSVPERPGS
jgi:hypothetical protein